MSANIDELELIISATKRLIDTSKSEQEMFVAWRLLKSLQTAKAELARGNRRVASVILTLAVRRAEAGLTI